jgi:hypothetical protein
MKFILTFLLLISSIAGNAQTPLNSKWDFQSSSGSVLKFKNGKTYDTHLYSLEYIGQIPNGNKAPFLIFSGKDCDECDANISIYVHSSANGKLSIDNGANRYQYPGKEKDYENNELVYESRSFYGQVLKNTFGLIWYQKDLMDNSKWKKSIFLIQINNGVQKEMLLTEADQLNQTLVLLKKGLCKEIKGINYTTEP